MKSYYQILRLSSDKAPAEEVEAAYRRLLAEFAGNADYRRMLDEAYGVLGNAEKRAEYDRRLAVAAGHALAVAAAAEARSKGGFGRWLVLALLLLGIGGFYWNKQRANPVRSAPPTLAAESPVQEAEEPTEQPEPSAGPPTASEPPAYVLEQLPDVPKKSGHQPQFVRPAKGPGFDPAYMAWSVYLVLGTRSRGSGVMVAPGRVMTNCHVIAGNALGGLVVVNSATREWAKVDRYSKLEDDEDVCLLSVPGAPTYVAEWGRSAALDIDATTHTVSFPGNEGLTWSSGKLLRRETPLGMEVLITSNYCRPGVSGGPLFDDGGRIVGITSAVRMFRSGGSECMSVTSETARKVEYKPMVPIGLAPAQYDPAMIRR